VGLEHGELLVVMRWQSDLAALVAYAMCLHVTCLNLMHIPNSSHWRNGADNGDARDYTVQTEGCRAKDLTNYYQGSRLIDKLKS
jgi:hypothetical protein